MNITTTLKRTTATGSVIAVLVASGIASAAATTDTTATTKAAAAAATSAADQARLQTIITKGDQEINRRLTSLSGLDAKITAAVKLTAGDKSTLSAQVNTEVSGLTALKAKLDAETTLAGAKTDAASIYTDYRVYALITPKIWLIKTADDQQVAEAKLTELAGKLQTRLTADQQADKDVTALQADLTDMNAKLAASTSISSTIESSVISLQPSDYDSNHAVLSGDNTKLKTAHTDNQAAVTDARNIVAGLKNL